MAAAETITVTAEQVRAQSEAILLAWGMSASMAAVTAEVMVDCDLRGIDTHGISLLALYAKWIEGDGFELKAEPEIERDGASYSLIDAKGGLGFAVSVKAVEMAVTKARLTGIAAVGVRNSHHFGAAGYYARQAGRAGMVCLVATSTKVVCVVPPGASRPVLGTNPIAYAVPRREGEPIVFDMATSTAAGNKIRLHQLSNKPVPEGWVVDGQGRPVTDPNEASRLVYEPGEGGLTPLGALPHLGSHKGYGLALLAHFLGGALTGGTFAGSPNGRKGKPEGDNIGHFFIAIDPNAFQGIEAFLDDVQDVEQTLIATPPIDERRPVILPGDLEQRVFAERSAAGIPLATALVVQLSEIAAKLNVTNHLELEQAQG